MDICHINQCFLNGDHKTTTILESFLEISLNNDSEIFFYILLQYGCQDRKYLIQYN